jgi:cell fate (sporulation/competence/biofilm development) regulator YmcA (YheA/YmcA/DUF963 family)
MAGGILENLWKIVILEIVDSINSLEFVTNYKMVDKVIRNNFLLRIIKKTIKKYNYFALENY